MGERLFITAKLPDYIRVGHGDDVIEKYLFFATSHDGSGSITAAFTPVRVVCQNTLNAALRNMSNVLHIRHTTGAKQRLEQEQTNKIHLEGSVIQDEIEPTIENLDSLKALLVMKKTPVAESLVSNVEKIKVDLKSGKKIYLRYPGLSMHIQKGSIIIMTIHLHRSFRLIKCLKYGRKLRLIL